MMEFYFEPAVFMNRMGETIVVTGWHSRNKFNKFVDNYSDGIWEYICDL